MKIRISTIWITVIALCLGGSAFSQDFNQLLEAVEKIESNLKDLIKQEATLRGRQFSELKSTIAKNKNLLKGLQQVASARSSWLMSLLN